MKILLVTSRHPWPPRRGDQMRAVQTAEFLAEEHEVTILAPEPSAAAGRGTFATDDTGVREPRPWRVETYRLDGGAKLLVGFVRALHQGLPLQSSLFYHRDLGRRLRELAPRHDLVVLQLVRLAIHLEDVGDRPLVVDLIDSLSLNFTMRATVDRPWLRVPLKAEARLLSHWERRLAARALRTVLVCDRDRQAIATRLPPALAARLRVVPLAVRERRAEPPPVPVAAASPAAPMIALTGNLGYFVNVDAARWFLEQVWPALHAARPEVRLVVAGDRPHPSIGALVRGSGAELVESPGDLRALLASATIALAPMRCGSGLPIKVLEAWSVGVPVVGTPYAVAGTAGIWNRDFLVAESPEAWVKTILALVDDPAARRRLAESGRERLAASYSRRVVRHGWLDLVAEVAGERAAGRAPAGGPARSSQAPS